MPHDIRPSGIRRIDIIGGGRGTRDGPNALTGFEIAGADRQFVPPSAHPGGDSIFVRCVTARRPTTVRLVWDKHAASSLMNIVGLPVSMFHTDPPSAVIRDAHFGYPANTPTERG